MAVPENDKKRSVKKLLDKDIREPLFEFLEEHYGKVRIIEEKSLGDARADAVMVRPSELVGIEIKSDGDTYARLKTQIKTYDRFFDGNMIVVGSTHALHVGEHVPDHWGIISVEAKERDDAVSKTPDGSAGADSAGVEYDFYIIREYRKNPVMEMASKIKILWRPELAKIQEKYNMHAYKSASKDFVRGKVVEKIPEEFLNQEISEALFERDYNKIAEEINAFRRAKGRRAKRKRPKKRKLRLL